MNAVFSDEFVFAINPRLKADVLAEQFKDARRVHIADFLPHQTAEALSRYLVDRMAYRTFIVANEDEFATALADGSLLTDDEQKEIFELACDGARNGFASCFEASRSLSNPEALEREASRPDVYQDCVEFFNSDSFLEFARSVSGVSVNRAEMHATQFRPGHFVLFNSGTASADPSGKRRMNFELNLTHQWRPEWGGMLEMRGKEGHQIEAVMPCFNCLELFAFPKGYWISQVTPFAHAFRYAVAGSLYAD